MPELEKYTNDIKQLCIAHKVKRLYALGSVITDKYVANSDIDFIVNFEPINLNQYADNYYDLKFSLETILRRPIDLLEEKAIKNPYFLQVVGWTGITGKNLKEFVENNLLSLKCRIIIHLLTKKIIFSVFIIFPIAVTEQIII